MHLNPCKRQKIAVKTKVKELPEDVLGDILMRLPVKSLVRLRCVSNSWLSLITHHTFVRLHLNYHHRDDERDENHKNQLQMDGVIRIQPHKSFSYEYGEIDVGLEKEEAMEEIIFDIYYYQKEKEDEDYAIEKVEEDYEEDDEKEEEIDCPSILRTAMKFTVVGQCNGLLCMEVAKKVGRVVLIIWNPSLREYIKLPRPPHPKKFKVIHGIGYDPHSEDYKVVRIVQGSQPYEYKPVVYVLALKTKLWRRIPSIPPFVVSGDEAIFANDSLYWIGDDHSVVIRFDLVEEKFLLLDLPVRSNWYFSILVNNRGSVCLATFVNSKDDLVRVWSLSPKNVWIKLVTIHGPSFVKSWTPPRLTWSSAFLFRLLSRGNGEICQRLGFRKFRKKFVVEQAFCYKESLVSPRGLFG